MKPYAIYNLIILDESGSMMSIYDQALSGANETITAIRNAQIDNPDVQQYLSFVTFDSGCNRPEVRAIIENQPIAQVKYITKSDYRPNGCTPLYDAMGKSITELKAVATEEDNVLVTVITDGFENSSHSYSASMVKELVDALRAKGWVFTYIGANQSSVEVAGELGIHNSMDFCQDAAGTAMMWAKLNSSRREYYRRADKMRRTGVHEDLEMDFFSQKKIASRVTPSRIHALDFNQVFVFGSDLEGRHEGAAAHYAVERFGALIGKGSGLQGQSYAIPTKQGGVETIKPYVDEFLRFADRNRDMTFFVTEVGCGKNGFIPKEIAPLFAEALALPNVFLPKEFWEVIDYRYSR